MFDAVEHVFSVFRLLTCIWTAANGTNWD